MKLVTYSKDGIVSFGILTETGIIDIQANWQWPNKPKSMVELLELGKSYLDKLGELIDSASETIPLDTAKILAPIQKPGKVIALAGNYSEHIKEAGLKLGLSEATRQNTVPRPFIMPSTVIIGYDEQISWPVYSEQIDYELELAIVIGKAAKCITSCDALNYIAGYTIVNDVSARSVTFKANRAERPWDEFYDWLNGKWADGFLPMGPFILTADEVPDVQNLDMELKVNGRTRQKANTSQMIYSVVEIVSFVSRIMTLEPGDIIATGTPCGVAMATGEFLEEGSLIECSIENLGILKNTVGPKPKKFYKPLV